MDPCMPCRGRPRKALKLKGSPRVDWESELSKCKLSRSVDDTWGRQFNEGSAEDPSQLVIAESPPPLVLLPEKLPTPWGL